MGIPTVASYPMPTGSELPDPRVAWQADASRAVLLIHDMQRYFVDPFVRGQPPVTELIDNIRLLHTTATELALPVVYTAQPGGMTRAERGLLHDFWGPGMGTDPHGRQIVGELAPVEPDTVLTKWRYSAFHRTELANLLRRHGRDQLIICGIYAHIGCLMTACDAFTLDVEPFFVADAVADFSPAEHRMALDYAARRCAATVSTSHVVHSLLRPHAAVVGGRPAARWAHPSVAAVADRENT